MKSQTRSEADRSAPVCSSRSAWMTGAALLGLIAVQPAHAQGTPDIAGPAETDQPGPADAAAAPAAARDIVVTGSRIVRRDFVASSPIVTVDSSLLERSGSVALEANLNKLPQFAPALTQFVTGDFQTTATNTPGASTVNLRNLGANRNLVLIDGRRATPVNATLVVDINSIPSAAVERVEVISGGASSTYGADAVGGVVNFILKKNFQGVEVDGQMGITQRGDGLEYRVSSLIGANFDGGRGNVILGMEHYKRKDVRRFDRAWARDLAASSNIAGTELFATQDYYAPTALGGGAPAQSVVNSIFNQVPAGAVPNTAYMYLNNDGTIFSGVGTNFCQNCQQGVAGVYRYNGPLDGVIRKITNNVIPDGNGVARSGLLAQNSLEELLSTPSERWSFFARAHYEFSNNLSFFTQASFAKTRVDTISQYAPAVEFWAAVIPHGNGAYEPSVSRNASGVIVGGNPAFNPSAYGISCANFAAAGCSKSEVFPTSPELTALLNSRADPEAPWSFNHVMNEFGVRNQTNDTLTFQVTAGLEGKIPGTDWTWEVYGSHGETSVESDLNGFISRERWRAVAQSPNYGRNSSFQANSAAPGFGVFGATARCTNGFSPFDTLTAGDDCRAAVTANLQNESRAIQDIVEGNLQGGLFSLPAGTLRFALGSSYRMNSYSYDPDSLSSQNTAFYEGIVGVFPAGRTRGKTIAKEVYGELLVPVLSDLPLVKQFDLELGYRYSDYNVSGAVSTYKILGDWAMTDWLRLRGGYQKANRAPNVAELFQGETLFLGGSSIEGDPCSRANPVAAHSANPARNANAAQVEALCRVMMGPGANTYYSNPQNATSVSGGVVNQVGNPNVQAENARTYTVGAVIRSPFESPWFSRLRASIDYYRIEVTGAIGTESEDTVGRLCFSSTYNPTYDPANEACQRMARRPDNGNPNITKVGYTNGGTIKTAGVDLQLDWGWNLGDIGVGLPGTLNLNFLVNYLDSFSIQDSPQVPAREYAGTLGGVGPGQLPPAGGTFRYRTFITVSYMAGPASVALQWRHMPSSRPFASVSDPNTPVLGPGNYHMFDLSATFAPTKTITLRAGIDNLFDRDPPVADRNPANQGTNALIGGLVAGNVYDVLGRRFYIGAKAKF